MNLFGEIILIEDDFDDIEFYNYAFESIKVTNKIKIFKNGKDALNYLKLPEVIPFLIISDINMPGINGYQLREVIINDPVLLSKCMPYIFITNADAELIAAKGYKLSVHGIFKKPSTINDFKKLLDCLINYWKFSLPNNYGYIISR